MADATDPGVELDERTVTPRRLEWSRAHQGDWANVLQAGDRARARQLYEEFGEVLEDEVADEGGAPVLSMAHTNALIRERVRTMTGRRALDVGCGPTPVAAIALHEAGFHATG